MVHFHVIASLPQGADSKKHAAISNVTLGFDMQARKQGSINVTMGGNLIPIVVIGMGMALTPKSSLDLPGKLRNMSV